MKNNSAVTLALTHVTRGAPRFTLARRGTSHRTRSRSVQSEARAVVDDDQRRSKILERLYTEHVLATSDSPSFRVASDVLPPDRWINERLAGLGEDWRVQSVDGYRYEIYSAT